MDEDDLVSQGFHNPTVQAPTSNTYYRPAIHNDPGINATDNITIFRLPDLEYLGQSNPTVPLPIRIVNNEPERRQGTRRRRERSISPIPLLPPLEIPIQNVQLPDHASDTVNPLDIENSLPVTGDLKPIQENEKPYSNLNISDIDEAQTCTICLDIWTNSGEHRLTSLKCGHLFGHSCIKRWLKEGQKEKYCPTCKTRATLRDMRFIYARKLIALDTSERDRLAEQLEKLTAVKAMLELENKVNMLNNQIQIEDLKRRIDLLTNQCSNILPRIQTSSSEHNVKLRNFYLEKTIELATEPSCRVMRYNKNNSCLAISFESQSSIFPGFGIKMVDMKTFKPLNFIHISAKPVRDIAFSPFHTDLLLTATMDVNVKLYDLQAKRIVQTYATETPSWACCWDPSNSNSFYIGGHQGLVTQYDMRLNTQVTSFKVGDMSPVVALAEVTAKAGNAFSQGLLCCKLNSFWAIEARANTNVNQLLPFEGPFMSLSNDNKTGHVLVSSRPSQKHNQCRHVVSTLTKQQNNITANIVHTFTAGKAQTTMSRSTQINIEDETYVAAHAEDLKLINIWSMKTGDKIKSLPTSDSITDLCPVEIGDDKYLTALSVTKLRIYKHSDS